jgi:O-antigen ligase
MPVNRILTNTNTDQLLYCLLLLFLFVLPFSQYLSVRILVVATLISLIIGLKKSNPNRFLSISWDILFYLFVLIIGLLYSSDLIAGAKILETNFSFLALPLLLSRIVISSKKLEWMYLSFILGLISASSVCLSFALFSFSQDHEFDHFLYYNLTDPIGFQPTYFAYYLSFAICLLLYGLYANQIKMSRLVIIAVILFLFFILMFTAGRTAYLAMLLILSFFILKYFLDDNENLTSAVALLSAFLLLSILLVNYFDLNAAMAGSAEGTDFWERFTLWNSALRANPSPLFGVGTGDYKDVLNQYYLAQGMSSFANGSFNAHNEFIQVYFSNGIIGLFSLCLLISRPIYLSFKVQNPLGILIIFPFIIYGITEVFLGRFQGIVFFVFCHQLVIHQYYLIKPRLALNENIHAA